MDASYSELFQALADTGSALVIKMAGSIMPSIFWSSSQTIAQNLNTAQNITVAANTTVGTVDNSSSRTAELLSYVVRPQLPFSLILGMSWPSSIALVLALVVVLPLFEPPPQELSRRPSSDTERREQKRLREKRRKTFIEIFKDEMRPWIILRLVCVSWSTIQSVAVTLSSFCPGKSSFLSEFVEIAVEVGCEAIVCRAGETLSLLGWVLLSPFYFLWALGSLILLLINLASYLVYSIVIAIGLALVCAPLMLISDRAFECAGRGITKYREAFYTHIWPLTVAVRQTSAKWWRGLIDAVHDEWLELKTMVFAFRDFRGAFKTSAEEREAEDRAIQHRLKAREMTLEEQVSFRRERDAALKRPAAPSKAAPVAIPNKPVVNHSSPFPDTSSLAERKTSPFEAPLKSTPQCRAGTTNQLTARPLKLPTCCFEQAMDSICLKTLEACKKLPETPSHVGESEAGIEASTKVQAKLNGRKRKPKTELNRPAKDEQGGPSRPQTPPPRVSSTPSLALPIPSTPVLKPLTSIPPKSPTHRYAFMRCGDSHDISLPGSRWQRSPRYRGNLNPEYFPYSSERRIQGNTSLTEYEWVGWRERMRRENGKVEASTTEAPHFFSPWNSSCESLASDSSSSGASFVMVDEKKEVVE